MSLKMRSCARLLLRASLNPAGFYLEGGGSKLCTLGKSSLYDAILVTHLPHTPRIPVMFGPVYYHLFSGDVGLRFCRLKVFLSTCLALLCDFPRVLV